MVGTNEIVDNVQRNREMIMNPDEVAEAEKRFIALSKEMSGIVRMLIDKAGISHMVGVEITLDQMIDKFSKAIKWAARTRRA